MEYLTASGVCLALLVGSIIYEARRMKIENRKIMDRIMNLYQNHK